MLTQIELKQNHLKRTKRVKRTNILTKLMQDYVGYCNAQEAEKIYWYLKAIIVIPCVLMPPSIIAMAQVTDQFVPYIAVTMLLFFSNVVVHIGQFKAKYFVPIYHATFAIMILAPAIVYLITKV